MEDHSQTQKKRRTALYARVSTDMQAGGLESQIRALRIFCEQNNITDFELFADEGIRPQIEQGYVSGKKKARSKELARLQSYHPDRNLKSTDLDAADKQLNDFYKIAVAAAGDPEAKDQLKIAQRAWIAYRDAELAFYKAAFGSKFGDAAVELDMKTHLTTARSKELRPGVI
jgi:uncharacterized protein YecT (DUF1311 family)